MTTKTKLACNFFSICLMLLVLSVGPALGKEPLKETDELYERILKLYQARKYAEAIPPSQKVVDITEKAFGPDHPDVAGPLNTLADLYTNIGDYAKAESLYRRVLGIYEKAYGPDDLRVTYAVDYLARLYQTIGDYEKAESLYRRSLGIKEKALGSEDRQVTAAVDNLAGLYGATGDYAKAESLYRRSLGIKEKALGLNDFGVALTVEDLARLYQAMGDYAKAEPLYRRALGIREKTFGPDHPAAAQSLTYLARLYKDMGDYAKAEPLYRRALEINEKAYGPDDMFVSANLGNLAWFYKDMGDYAKAEPLYLRSLTINEKIFGPDSLNVAFSRSDLAEFYFATRDYAKAVSFESLALGIRETRLTPDHPDVAQSLNNLAAQYREMGEYAKAEPLFRRALRIREKVFGAENTYVAQSLSNLALLYYSMDDYANAEPLFRRSLEIYEKAYGPDHLDVGAALLNLAAINQAIGESAKAEPLYRRALRINEKALGQDHVRLSDFYNFLASSEASQQQYRSAFGLFNKGIVIEDRKIQNVFTIMTEEQKLTFMQSYGGAYTACLSLIHQHLMAEQDAVRDGLALVLRRKGVVFDAQSRSREALQGRMSEAARKDWDMLSSVRSELARLLLNKPEKMTAEAYKEKLTSLQHQIEDAEKRLASESALVAKELKQRTLTVEAVAKGLSKKGVLVEFVRIRDFDFTKGRSAQTSRYLAFVLTETGKVTLVDLGEANALEIQVKRALQDIKVSMQSRNIEMLKKPDRAQPNQPSMQSLKDLYAQVWGPLQKALGGAEKVVVSPDGLLNLVPFAALVDNQGRSLVERYQLAYVTSGRELVGVEGTMPRPDSDLLLVANPSFDQKGSDSGRPGTALRSREFRGVFTPLPGTERESREIPPLVVAPKEQKQVLVGERATETAVKAARSPRILHLATHGFFLPDSDVALDAVKLGGLPDRGITVVPRPTAKRYENPLVRSGLAFAGANQATTITDGDDGILTALEITGMDLYGTELVVLSACDTGVGEIKTGEGVFGLRRAFALAGAKNLLMSLWEVSDDVTARQMKMFYQNLQKLPLAQALRQAQLETIKELKAEYGGLAPPGLWAPFILQGAQALGQ